MPPRPWLPAAWLAGLLVLSPAHADGAGPALRDAFATAYAAAQAGQPAPPDGDPADLVAYPLYPYLQAARLGSTLDVAPTDAGALPLDADISQFLAAHADEPVSRLLRRPWLESLAARRQWRAYLDAYAGASSPDQDLRCFALQARIALRPQADVAQAAVDEWLSAASADDACDPVFDWLRDQGLLDDALIERRARLALADGGTRLARWLARSLPDAEARPIRDWATLIENPRGAVDALIASPRRPVAFTALLDGWTRLARRDPTAAADRYATLVAARSLDAAQASKLARAVALGLAWNRDDDALAYFDRVAPADFDDSSYEWRARAALWARDWTAVAKDIAAMPASMRDDPRWRYWAARAAAENGEPDLARRLYSTVVPTDNWYAVLAAARLGQPFAPHPQPIALDTARVEALAGRPAFRRAHELLLLGWLSMAQSEWNAGYGALDAPGRQAAIGLADRWGWYFQSIATAARLDQFDDYALLYPTPFDDVVNGAARLTHLPAVLIYAVIRQESLYQPQAVSGAGAVGLMQLMPSTARRVAAQLNRRRPSRSRLMLPEVNVPLGAGRLSELLDRLGGQVLVALAAYNAGPNAARRWLPEHPLDADIWVENIPYNETRAYVQRVMWHSVVFSWLHDRKAEGARSWLAQVKPVG